MVIAKKKPGREGPGASLTRVVMLTFSQSGKGSALTQINICAAWFRAGEKKAGHEARPSPTGRMPCHDPDTARGFLKYNDRRTKSYMGSESGDNKT